MMKEAAAQRARAVRRVLWITLFLNLLVAGAKLGYGQYTETLSMVADGFHSLLDSTSNIIGLIAMGFAAKPPDRNHPYGHRKIEAIVAIMISGMLFFACYEIFTHAWARLHTKMEPDVTLWSFLIMIVTMAINYGVSRYEHRKGHELKSQILTSDSAHTASDVWASLSVLVALAGVKFNIPHVDIIAASFIAIFVGYSGYKIVVESLNTLLDSSQLDPKPIVQAVMTIPGILSAHNVRTRGHSTAIFMDLNIHVDPKLSLEDAHQLTHQVIDKIKDTFPEVVDVVVHTEPATHGHE